jgi:hypothetical protein
MAFDFEKAFGDAVQAGVAAAKPGGGTAQDWLREIANANEGTLRAIADGVATKKISKDTAEMLLVESANALRTEAAALSVISKAPAQAAVNAFIDSLYAALKSALKLAF